jgi:hypothetical protein
MGRYRAQLVLYAAAWERITGERVGETLLVFTASTDGSGSVNVYVDGRTGAGA